MFAEKISRLREICGELDDRTCKRLKTKQFGDMLIIILDKGLLDESKASQEVIEKVDKAYELLEEVMANHISDSSMVRHYLRRYMKALEAVRKAYGLEPAGNIQGRWLALGVALGSGVGTALMSAVNPGMMSVGIGVGLTLGIAIGQKKEQEAKEQGKIF